MLQYWEREGWNSLLCLGLLQGSHTPLWKLDWEPGYEMCHRLLVGPWSTILKPVTKLWLSWSELLLHNFLHFLYSYFSRLFLSVLQSWIWALWFWSTLTTLVEFILNTVMKLQLTISEEWMLSLQRHPFFSDRLKSRSGIFLVWPPRRGLWKREGRWTVEL